MAGNCFWLLLHRASTLKGIDKFRLKHYRIPSAIYMFKVSKKQTRAMCQIYSKFFFFYYQSFLSQTLTIHRTAGQWRGSLFVSIYHFHLLTNIQTFICNFGCEVTSRIFRVRSYMRGKMNSYRFRDFKPAWKQVLFTWSFISAAFRNNSIFWWACLGISFRVAYILSSEMKFNLCQNDLIGHNIMGNALSWEMPPKNIFFASYTLIMGTLKGSTDRFLISVPEVKILQRVRMDPICFKGAL